MPRLALLVLASAAIVAGLMAGGSKSAVALRAHEMAFHARLQTRAGSPRSPKHAARRRTRHRRRATKIHVVHAPSVDRLQFGVYPWGAAGAVSQVEPQLADQPFAALRAVKQLQGSRSMTVHLYGQYTGADADEADALLSDAKWWSDNGVRVEIVLRYRPASADLSSGYVPWVSEVATRLAAIRDVVAIQVGNEANSDGSPAASDGAYPGAVRAVALGVAAARRAVIAAGRSDIGVGFNWAAGGSPCALDPFFAQLQRAGGRAFVNAVGWVGIDVYPGTWSAPAPSAHPRLSLIADSVTSSLRCLRTRQMPSAGLSSAASITVTETGYPTDPARSEQSQVAVLRQIVAATQSVSRAYGVTGLRWFGLRDANTKSGQLENGYGLLHDDYSPKPAFAAYEQIIAADGR
jgi:hypothetical protein